MFRLFSHRFFRRALATPSSDLCLCPSSSAPSCTRFLSTGPTSSSLSTIFALSSGHGKCGVAVVRVSGPQSADAIKSLCRPAALPPPRQAVLRSLFDPADGCKLDQGLVLWFPGPRSFTGDDCVEFQVHGGLAVTSSVLRALGRIEGLRPAEPGEFTKRAFHAGKLDLTQVEGLGDLIHAETEHQRRQALRQMDGVLFRLYGSWRERLIKLVAHVEAFIDFQESEDIEDDIPEVVRRGVEELMGEMEAHLDDARAGERLRDGVRVAIVGRPNAGKSSLLNRLVQRPKAIVSPIAGTTRDLIEARLDIGGYPATVVDTAGLRGSTDDAIEREGMDRAVKAAKEADLVVLVIAAPEEDRVDGRTVESYLREFGLDGCENCLVLVNKMDLIADDFSETFRLSEKEDLSNVTFGSCTTGEGMDRFVTSLQASVGRLCVTSSGESPTLTRTRYRLHLQRACGHLDKYLDVDGDWVIGAHHLRRAVREVGVITGKVNAEQILDVIFADFCVGK